MVCKNKGTEVEWKPEIVVNNAPPKADKALMRLHIEMANAPLPFQVSKPSTNINSRLSVMGNVMGPPALRNSCEKNAIKYKVHETSVRKFCCGEMQTANTRSIYSKMINMVMDINPYFTPAQK